MKKKMASRAWEELLEIYTKAVILVICVVRCKRRVDYRKPTLIWQKGKCLWAESAKQNCSIWRESQNYCCLIDVTLVNDANYLMMLQQLPKKTNLPNQN